MRVPAILRLLLLLLAFAPASAFALIDEVSWQATRIVRVDGREIVTQVRHTPTRERISAVLHGIELTFILRGDRNLLWQLTPNLSVYGEVDLTGFDTPQTVHILARERLGEETVAGQRTTKYRARFRSVDGDEREGFYWQNAAGIHLRSRFPLPDRNGALRQVELELRNVQAGPQAASWFEVPEGYFRLPLDAGTLLDLLGT